MGSGAEARRDAFANPFGQFGDEPGKERAKGFAEGTPDFDPAAQALLRAANERAKGEAWSIGQGGVAGRPPHPDRYCTRNQSNAAPPTLVAVAAGDPLAACANRPIWAPTQRPGSVRNSLPSGTKILPSTL